MDYKYHLQKYSGPKSRHTCPECGKRNCFTLYVDENGDPLNETVGRCDHESSCGYHYTPSQYFKDNPWKQQTARNPIAPTTRQNRHIPAEICTIPDEYVIKSVTYGHPNHLLQWMGTFIDPLIIEGLIHEYSLGTTRNGDIIYFQIDTGYRCRTGKIMKYDPLTGHRIKDPDIPGKVTWVHTILKQRHILPESWVLTQCLFGEHLLGKYPGRKVMLVESEKTALIGCAYLPQFNWLATGGKSNLSPAKLGILRGKEVIAFPDLDALQDWIAKLAPYPDIKVSDLISRAASGGTLPSGADLADWLTAYFSPGVSPVTPVTPVTNGTDETPGTYRPLSPLQTLTDNWPQVKLLIEELDLELISESWIE